MMKNRPLITPAEAKRQFEAHGLSIAVWAKEHGFAPRSVYAVLNGHAPAKRGQAHRIAVALGIKQAPAGEGFVRASKK